VAGVVDTAERGAVDNLGAREVEHVAGVLHAAEDLGVDGVVRDALDVRHVDLVRVRARVRVRVRARVRVRVRVRVGVRVRARVRLDVRHVDRDVELGLGLGLGLG